jgi:3-dehydroquinate dehydratase
LAIYPYLREKKVQASVTIEYCQTVGIGKAGWHTRIKSEKVQQEWYYKKLRELKEVQYAPGQSPESVSTTDDTLSS